MRQRMNVTGGSLLLSHEHSVCMSVCHFSFISTEEINNNDRVRLRSRFKFRAESQTSGLKSLPSARAVGTWLSGG